MDFENKAPKWDATGAEPSADLQENGFMAGYKPPAAYFNYLFNRIVAAIKEIQSKLSKVDNTADSEKPVSTAQATAIADAKKAGTDAQTNLTKHAQEKNPHGTTASDVGAAAASDHRIRTFSSLEQLGITVGQETMSEIASALPVDSELVYVVGVNNNKSEYPYQYGNVRVCKTEHSRISFDFFKHYTVDPTRYIGWGSYSGSKIEWSGWVDVTHFLPLTGGTLSGHLNAKGITFSDYGYLSSDNNHVAIRAMLQANATQNADSIIQLLTSNMQPDTAKKIRFSDTNSKWYYLFGEHNKVGGSYTGNGSATQRTVNVGGIGYNLVITSDIGTAWVSSRGAICLNRSTGAISGLKSWECYLKDGVLTIATDSELVNKSSQAYWYDLL